MRGVPARSCGVVRSVQAAEDIRHVCSGHPGWRSSAALPGELVVAHVDARLSTAVVTALERYHCLASGVRARQAQRELVGLAAGVYQEADRERFGE